MDAGFRDRAHAPRHHRDRPGAPTGRSAARVPRLTAVERGRVRLRGLTVTYQGASRAALADLDLDVAPGECLLVLGPSGSGKSTLALALGGLLGSQLGATVAGEAAAGGPVGLVFQDPETQLVMERVDDDVAFGLENRGWATAAMRARVPAAIADAGLAGFDRRRTATLSGGEQQRLALAGALAPEPPILVLDEPTANLDPAGAATFIERLRGLRARGVTIVLVEHRVELAWSLADRVLVLDGDGGARDVGSPEAVVGRQGPVLVEAGVWLPDAVLARLGAQAAAPFGAQPAPGSPVVVAEDVWYGYRRGMPVVRGAGLAIGEAERVALVGVNGSGKSTLGRLLVGLLRADRGRVRLGGRSPDRFGAADLARIAGYLFQDPERQFLAATVADEVALGLRPAEKQALPELLQRLDLELGVFGGRSPYELSGGEQRRLSLACVLARRPRLLVLDEPTFGQDRRTYLDILGVIAERMADGAAVLAITHDPRLVRDMGGRALRMDAGRVDHMPGDERWTRRDASEVLAAPAVQAAMGGVGR